MVQSYVDSFSTWLTPKDIHRWESDVVHLPRVKTDLESMGRQVLEVAKKGDPFGRNLYVLHAQVVEGQVELAKLKRKMYEVEEERTLQAELQLSKEVSKDPCTLR
eukprot:NODE_2027_length_465_cov_22.350962_g1948_i0.p1 GENE.NODE_2027_length_465_cov_22.350962_g1948_i0~~NODE_2027_length_465_cov_22.350962_g1948_i0.p1  ORF type:complete len:105 (-),score=19.29 NODE_2027_length_465_cov_22.350962_g1948_i0:3-317(-)